MNHTRMDKFGRKRRRLQGLKRRDNWDRLCPVTRWVDPSRPYCRAREKQELRALFS